MVCYRSLTVLGCLVVGLFLSGCDSTTSTGSNATTNSTSRASKLNPVEEKSETEEVSSVSLPEPKPLFEEWEGDPALAIVLSGEQNGFLEPCGCSETQSGGMARRADLFAQLEEKGWPVTAMDVGNFLRKSRRQSELKFDAIFDSLTDLEYAATGIGPSEVNLGSTKLLERGLKEAPSNDQIVPQFVSANVTIFNDPELGAIHRTRVYEVNGVKIGVTGVIGESIKKSMLQTNQEEIQVLPVEETLPQAVEELKAADADLYVLLSYAETEESQAAQEVA